MRLSLSDVFASLDTPEQDGEPPMLYVGSTMIDKWLPGFREENDLKLAQREPIASIWMGNRSRIAAHYDELKLYVHVYFEKEFFCKPD